MNYIQWPWEIITINDGKRHGVSQNSIDQTLVLAYQGSGGAGFNAPQSSARQPLLPSYIPPPSGRGRRHQHIAEDLDAVVGTFLGASIPNPPPVAPQLKDNRFTANAGIQVQGVKYASNEQPCTHRIDAYCRNHISHDREQRPTRTGTRNASDSFANLVNSLDRIEESLKVLIHQYQRKGELYQAIGAEHPISLIHESAINSNNSLDRLRDILGDGHSILAPRTSASSSPGQSHPDIHLHPALSRSPLVNALYSVEKMAREINDSFQPSIERSLMPGSAAPPSDFDSRFPNPSHRRPASRTFYNPQEGTSHDRQPSHVLPMEPALFSLCEAAQNSGLKRDDIGSRTSASASLGSPTIAYYSPDPIANVMLESLTLQGDSEGVNTPLSPHSILDTPVPRAPVRARETSTPVSFSGSALSTDFPGDYNLRRTNHDSPDSAAQTPPWGHSRAQAASLRSTIVPEFPAPSTIDSMMQMLRDVHSAQVIAIEQQHENMNYMRALNEWLGLDVHERQTEIRGIAENFNQLRDYLYRLGSGPSFIYPGLQVQPFNVVAPNPSLPHS